MACGRSPAGACGTDASTGVVRSSPCRTPSTRPFSTGHGTSAVPLKDQSAVLFTLLVGATSASTCKLLGENRKTVDRIKSNLALQRKVYVQKAKKSMVFGTGRAWKEVEADETVFRKHTDMLKKSGCEVAWDQWAGIVERGCPQSLVLIRLETGRTDKRSPGPGAIKKVDWAAAAETHIAGRHVVLHTDGAKSYKVKVDGVLHDSVRHCKKRVKVRGQWVWVQPEYAG